MRVIYATGQPRYLDFAIADKRAEVPAGAIVFAICTAERTIENLDEDLFAAISDEEYYTFRGLVYESEQLEKQPRPAKRPTIELSVDRFFRWLCGDKDIRRVTSS
jgi:hypothetical protein